MDNLVRLLLRFILVPLGFLAEAIAEAVVVFIVSWQRFGTALSSDLDDKSAEIVVAFIENQMSFFFALASMLSPILIGILISEALAIRSWMFHVLNGVVSCWIGWQLFGGLASRLMEPMTVIAAGIAGGFAYWAVAGFSAGFWKPVFRPDPPPNLPAIPR